MDKRMRRIFAILPFFIIIIAVPFNSRSKSQAFAVNDMDQQMQSLVTNLVQKNPTIRSCVLSVRKGDDSFAWTGAAGVSNQANQRPMGKDTPIYIASITKLYTAVVVMRLQEQGMLSLNDPIAKYLPEELIHGIHIYNGKDYTQAITIQQLLSHTSGIADYYTEKPKGGKSLFEVFLEEPERRWTVNETIEKTRKELKPHFQPGTGAFYSDTNFQLLGKIIEAVTGKPLQDIYDEVIFRPLGLTHTGLAVYSEPLGAAEPAEIFEADRDITKIRSNGSYWADGGIVSTADDMVTFLKALNEGRIVKKDTLRQMHHWHKIQFPFQYGYGTMYFNIPWPMNTAIGVPPLWGHSGSTGSFLYYDEDRDLYFAGTINQTKANMKPFQLMGSVIKVISTKNE